MLTKQPKQTLPSWPPLYPEKTHKVQDGENWWKLADLYGRKDPWDIIQYNFNTKTPEEVNYYLSTLVGCTRSNDGKNYSFSSSDSPGVIYIPHRSWRPDYGPYEKVDWAKRFQDNPYGLEADDRMDYWITEQMTAKVRFVEVPSLPVPCEFDYRGTVYVRPQRAGWNWGWITRECVHMAFAQTAGRRGYTPESDAIAWIKLVLEHSWTEGKYSRVPFPFHEARATGAVKQNICRAAGEFLRDWNTIAKHRRFQDVVAAVRRDPDCTRRMAGHPPVAGLS